MSLLADRTRALVDRVATLTGVATLTLRDRLLEAAVELTTTAGWAKVTMARLADEVGVSRQTVYNEIGTKNDLDRKSTRLNSSHIPLSRMPSSA